MKLGARLTTLHFNGAARYNDTHGKNKIASRQFGFAVARLADVLNVPTIPVQEALMVNCTSAPYHWL